MVAIDIVCILQQVPGQDRHHVVSRLDHASFDQHANACERRRRCRLAPDPAPTDDSLGIGDLLLGDGLHYTVGM